MILALLASSFNLGYIQVPEQGWNAPDYGPSYTPFGTMTVESLNMTLVGWFADTSLPFHFYTDLAITEDMNYAYVVDEHYSDPNRLVIVDMRDKENPVVVKVIDSISATNLLVKDTFLFVSWTWPYTRYFTVYNISDPVTPILVESESDNYGIEADDMIYLENMSRICLAGALIRLVDVSDPTSPELTFVYPLDVIQLCYTSPYLYALVPDTLYSHAYILQVQVNPDTLILLNTIDHWTPYVSSKTIASWKDESRGKIYLYCMGAKPEYYYDVTDPMNPIQINYGIRDPIILWARTDGHLIYASTMAEFYGITIFDPRQAPAYLPVVGYYRGDEPDVNYARLVARDGWVFGSGSHSEPWGGAFAILNTSLDTLEPPEPGELRILYPGPRLELVLNLSGEVCLGLYDISGRRAVNQDLGMKYPGIYFIPLDYELPQGVYFFQVSINDETFLTEKVVMTR